MVLEWTFYLSLVCSIIGIILFIYSLIIIKKIKELFPGTKLIKKWLVIQVLIAFFLVGYVFNIIFVALNLVELLTIMTALVYVFGALFVVIVINLGYKTYKVIILGRSED